MNRNDIIAGFLDRAVEDQSWYRKNANTINGTVAAAAAALTFLLAYVQATGVFAWSEALLVAIVPLITAISLKFTKNGVGAGQAQELKEKAKHESDTPTGPVKIENPTPTPDPPPAREPENTQPADQTTGHATLDQLRDIVARNTAGQ